MKPYGRPIKGMNPWPLFIPALSLAIWFCAGAACASVWTHWQGG